MEHTKAAPVHTVPVIHNRIKNNQVTALHLMAGLLLLVLGFITWIRPSEIKIIHHELLRDIGVLYLLFGLALIIISVFFNKKIIQSKKNTALRFLELLAFLPVIFYTLSQKWYLPFAYSTAAFIGIVFAYFWEKGAAGAFYIYINPKGISLPRFGSDKQILWRDIQTVIFKHDLITINCRNNKVFQFQIKMDKFQVTPQLRSFCTSQVAANEHLYQEDW